MRWYILLAHPHTDSFNHAVCRAFVQGLDDAGAVADVNNLYATGFNPIMAGDDFNQFVEGGMLPPDILAEQARVTRADCLALIYPVWWNEAPAILKGWIDRILAKGWAYDVTPDGRFLALLKLKKVLIFNTADNPTELLEAAGLNDATRLTKDVGTFGFCGVETVDHHILGNVGTDNAARQVFLKKVREIGRAG